MKKAIEGIIPDPHAYGERDILGMFRPEFPLPEKISEEAEETRFLAEEIRNAEKDYREGRYFEYDIATDNIHAMLNVLHVEGFLSDREFQDASNRYGLGIVVKDGRKISNVELFRWIDEPEGGRGHGRSDA